MDELLTRLHDLGLDDGTAAEVTETVRTFLEQKLPEELVVKLDDILSGDRETMGSLLEKVPADALPADVRSRVKGFLGG